jgi:hypothetical protein
LCSLLLPPKMFQTWTSRGMPPLQTGLADVGQHKHGQDQEQDHHEKREQG